MSKKNQPSILNMFDFSGGFCSYVPINKMADNELLVAENCYWDDALVKRNGFWKQASYTGTGFVKTHGFTHRAGTWANIVITQQTTSGPEVFIENGNTSLVTVHRFDSISNTLTSTFLDSNTTSCQFATFGDKVVFVNGFDQPGVIMQLPSNTLCWDFIERYDNRIRGSDYWVAGSYEVTNTVYTDHTASAQSLASTDFTLSDASSHGIFVGCNYTFNRVEFNDVAAAAVGEKFTWEYFGRASASGTQGWNVIASANLIPTNWGWTNSIVSKTALEFNLPQDGLTGETLLDYYTGSETSIIANKFMVRGYPTSPGLPTFSCAYLGVNHTQYLRQILLNDKPDTVTEYKASIFLGMGNWLTFSPFNSIKNWEPLTFTFPKAAAIKSFKSMNNQLLVILNNSIYGIVGNAYQTWTFKNLINIGTHCGDSCQVINNKLIFSNENGLYMFDGSNYVLVSRHIFGNDDYGSFFTPFDNSIVWRDKYYLSGTRNASAGWGTILTFDPDSFRKTDDGEGRVSFSKFETSQIGGRKVFGVSCFQIYDPLGTAQKMLYGYFCDPSYTLKLHKYSFDFNPRCATSYKVDFIGTANDVTTYAISMTMQSRYVDFGEPNLNKKFTRIKPVVLSVPYIVDDSCTFGFSFKTKYSDVSNSVSFMVAKSNINYEDTFSVPASNDGMLFSVAITSPGKSYAEVAGWSIGAERRSF